MCQGKLKKAFIDPLSSLVLPCCAWVVILTFVLATTTGTAGAREKLRTIVIDPGHGGSDHGITGPTQLLEKNITLAVAELIVKERKGIYRVVLTRTGDYGLSLYERTAVANNQRADLFISIHAGGSFSHKKTGCTIYYYKKASPGGTYTSINLPDPESFSAAPLPWDKRQTVHVPESKAAAKTIASQLSKPFLSRGSPLKTAIQGYPLAVLSGADMPALLMEIGHLANPQEEKKLSMNKYLSEIANKICKGIDHFFSKKNKANKPDE